MDKIGLYILADFTSLFILLITLITLMALFLVTFKKHTQAM